MQELTCKVSIRDLVNGGSCPEGYVLFRELLALLDQKGSELEFIWSPLTQLWLSRFASGAEEPVTDVASWLYEQRLAPKFSMANMDLRDLDLEGICFSHDNFQFANFSGANLRRTNFRFSDLCSTVLSNTTLVESYFANCRLMSAVMPRQLTKVSFNFVDLDFSHAFSTEFRDCSFRHVSANYIDLRRSKFIDCRFSNVDWKTDPLEQMKGASFVNCTFDLCSFSHVNFDQISFENCTHEEVTFFGCKGVPPRTKLP